ncbi:autotransporter outer membrane beta-barrel domain-containing protein [Escherichia coli]|uniref:autotransporter outer membrane beta-barrel domain-containing protein n=1 Tax=Escherichia coli TaxID=562 RepID=UPI000DA4F94D|nr:autotransporter outer membrane beta-barrel domain-containing protein [Escherichia coli]SQQ93395.1 outer membrane autotransporter domain protein [Escherichia coli]SQZ42741.1 outer membrane autotransporter domain protein [Escherichia coli]SQZ50758.1 outer membrane autotransporter domain protein [Escherichia coli]SQZ73684.1 outer membrane autotransporter domain protein [Escherichia coli]SRB27686.1 outer membrane autotransporter domain protein [Escherichia coli]
MKELKKINRYIMCFFLGSRLAYAENIDGSSSISNKDISGSLNIGIKQDANVNINGTVNIKDYFSVATCNGQSSTCPAGGLNASANIDKSASVGASVTIVGDSSKGELNIDGGSTLYTQQLWVSGNDNDKTSNVSDDSNGSLSINNGSNVFVVSSQADTPFKDSQVKWNQQIISQGNNITDGTVSSGDLVLGKTGNGIIDINNKSKLDVKNDVVVSTGVDGIPNEKPSEINIKNGSNFLVHGDMKGGISAAGKLNLNMDNSSNLHVDKNIAVGIGSESNITVSASSGSTISSDGNFTVATGNNSNANIELDASKLSVNGVSTIGSGDGSITKFNIQNGSVVTSSSDMTLAKGKGTQANINISSSQLNTGSLSVGEGDNADVKMTGAGASVSSKNTFTVAKGNNASATLDYSDSKINIGNGYIGVGEKSHTLLKLDNSTFHAAGNIDIGKGSSTIATVSVGAGSNMSIKGNASIGVGDQAKAKFSVKDSVLNIGSSLVLGQGNSTEAEMSVEHSQLYSGSLLLGTANNAVVSMDANDAGISVVGDYIVAKGDGSEATLIYKNSDINLGNGILGAGSGVKTDLSLDNSKFVASDGIIIGEGDNAITNLSISDNSVFKGERINIGNGAYSQNSISITGNSIFDFGSSQESTIGEGDYSQSLVTINDASVYGDGSLTLAKGNNSFAVLNLQDNAVTNANNISLATGLGSKAIVNVSNMNSGQFNPVSMGAGDGYAEVNFDGVNGYTLSTNFICMDSGSCADTVINVKRGTVSLSGTNDWKGQINVYDGTRLDARGNDAVDGILNVSKEAQVDFNGYSQHMTGIDNKGMIYLSDGSASSDVYLDKDYVAHDGSGVQFGIFGQKEADVMHVKGDTSGSSGIVVTTNSKNKIKKGGDILLVEVNGDSSGSFYLNSLIKNGKEYKVTGDYIDVGAWEYALNKKRKNWYLSVDMRPEPGAFINNSKSMLDMFALQRYDIPGQHRYPTLFENLYNNGMWIQFNNNSGSNSEVYDNLKTSYSLNTMMIGGDIYNWTDGYNYSHIGIMGGMGSAANKTTSTNNKRATGNVDGYTLGLYHVFQQNISDGLNESERQGLWTYSSIQYMDYDNSVSSTNNFKADYGVNGFRLTGEVGYLKNIGGIQPSDFYVEPKLYLSHTELSGGVVEDLQGGKITYPNSLTIIEPGVFFSYRKTHESTSNDEAMFKDYIKQSVVDAWFGGGYSFKTGNYSRTNFDSDMVEYNTSDNFVLKSGVEFEFLKDARLLLSSSYSINNDRNLSFILGGNYYF